MKIESFERYEMNCKVKVEENNGGIRLPKKKRKMKEFVRMKKWTKLRFSKS